MKKLFLSVIGLYVTVLSAFSKSKNQTDTSHYKARKLTFEEANIVCSFYRQDGNNSAVTGGIGTEKLTDYSNSIDLKLHFYDKRSRKHSLSADIGIDHYTSASSDRIDPKTMSSASYSDTRFYPSLGWTMENEKKGITLGGGISFSTEFDYQSIGANIHVSKKTAGKNGEITARLQTYFDQVGMIFPVELRNQPVNQGDEEEDDGDDFGYKKRNTWNGSLSWSQIINKEFQIMLTGEFVYQNGYLGLPFHRVSFSDNSVHVEKLPSSRIKVPLGIRANYFAGDKFILRSWYRFYMDDWGIRSNTAQLETVIKLTPFFSLSPFYRYYQQSASDHFAGYMEHNSGELFYTSSYDLSKFNSHFYGLGIRIAPPEGIFNIRHFHSLELRYGHYNRSTGLNSDIITLHLGFR